MWAPPPCALRPWHWFPDCDALHARCFISCIRLPTTTAYHSLWSESCLREFPILELFFCFGCSPTQEAYTNHTGKRVKLCESIADQYV